MLVDLVKQICLGEYVSPRFSCGSDIHTTILIQLFYDRSANTIQRLGSCSYPIDLKVANIPAAWACVGTEILIYTTKQCERMMTEASRGQSLHHQLHCQIRRSKEGKPSSYDFFFKRLSKGMNFNNDKQGCVDNRRPVVAIRVNAPSVTETPPHRRVPEPPAAKREIDGSPGL